MAEARTKDSVLALITLYVHKGDKLKGVVISKKIRYKAIWKYLLQFDWLVMKQGVLHCIYITNDVEPPPIGAPQRILTSCALHVTWWLWSSGIGPHIGCSDGEVILENDVPRCNRICNKLPSVSCSHTHLGSLVANNPLDLWCIDFLKIDASKDSKENILVLTIAFTKLSQAFIITNQKALTITKIFVDKWSYIYGILAHIASNKGWSFQNPPVLCV